MNNKKIKTICMFFLCMSAFITIIVMNSNSFALTKEKSDILNLKVISDTKEENSENIFFKVQDNPYVSKGKFAPGCVATSKIELDVTDVDFDFYFKINADTSSMSNNQKLTLKIEDTEYEFGQEITLLRKDFLNKSKIEITLTIEWDSKGDSTEDIIFMEKTNNMQIPINWEITQKI